jgi:glycosyltransferase involved in cell wall biosynthesis
LKKKLTYIISDINKSLAFEWTLVNIDNSKFDLYVILISNTETDFEKFLKETKINYSFLNIYKNGLKLLFSIISILIKTETEIIHCHLRKAQIFGLMAGFIIGVPKRIYTRHFSTYNHLYHPKGVYIDKICNWLSTDIIAISENVKNVLISKEEVNKNKIHLIHHGFDFIYFKNISEKSIGKIKEKYNIPTNKTIIGIIARYEWLKGYKFSIEAFKRLNQNNNYHLIIANAIGNNDVKNFIHQTLEKGSFTEIAFENDLASLYKCFDYYIHVPIEPDIEAFGQTYIEALATQTPSIFTLSGVASEFIINKNNAIVVPFQNIESIEKGINLLENDNKLKNEIIANGVKSVGIFDIKIQSSKLKHLYLSK